MGLKLGRLADWFRHVARGSTRRGVSPSGAARSRLGSGHHSVDGDGEYCLPHGVNGVLAGIGGLMLEPVITDALRMRRFYARPAYRRSGGRGLALAAHAEKWQWRENSS
jgi:hypothetical protein